MRHTRKNITQMISRPLDSACDLRYGFTMKNRKQLETQLNKDAWERVGGLSQPSKMPCYGYSIPAQTCKLGSILATVRGTTCSGCYALKGRYVMPTVKAALARRYASLDSPTWIDDMVRVIAWKETSGFFRWHDSGDLQSTNHLARIAEIARRLPNIRFWLPTREYSIVKAFVDQYGSAAIPANLTIRLSATKIDTQAPSIAGLPTSGVASNETNATCPARLQDNECRDCRACWNKEATHVIYKKH